MALGWSLFQTIFYEHDLRFVALAIGICALGSLTAIAVAQHAIKFEPSASRRGWLLLAGLVTGLTVWTTHFTAMLGYRIELDIQYDLVSAGAAILLAVILAMTAWVTCFQDRERGLLAGAIIAVGIALAHFTDMNSIRVAGTVHHSHVIAIIAVALGLIFGVLSGFLFLKWKEELLAWPSAMALFAAITSLHFVAMSGVSIPSGGVPVEASNWTATSEELTLLIVVSFFFILISAIALTWNSARLAHATGIEQRRLIEALEALRETQEHHRAYIELSPQIGWVADAQGRVTEIAPLWEELVGIPREDAHGEGWAQTIHPDDLPQIVEQWQQAVDSGDGGLADSRYRMRLADGSYKWFRVRGQPRRDENGAILAWYGSLEDIEDQVHAETALRLSEERYRLASRAANDVIWDWSYEKQSTIWAGGYSKVLGYPELAEGSDLEWWHDRIHPDDLPLVLSSQEEAIQSGAEFWNGDYRFRVASGDWIAVKSSSLIIRDGEGQVVRMVGSMLDITKQKLAQDTLNWAAHHDPLTGLPNRSQYLTSIALAIEEAKHSDRFVALVLLDLNRFKELNDTLGHTAGDKVLETIAERLSDGVPDGATVARLGGDEFAVILPGLEDQDSYRPIVERLFENLIEPVVFSQMRIPLAFSAGVAICPRDGDNPGDLLIAADLALYAAKEDTPGRFREFSPSLRADAEDRSQMLAIARSALEEEGIVPFYQPKIDLQTGAIIGWEALLRIRGSSGKVLLPSDIEAAFADAELTVRITDRMFASVFEDIAMWRSMGCDPGRIAINVSAGDFRQHRLAERLQFHASVHGLSVEQIDIELTENVLIGQLGAEVLTMIEELQALGVRVALDDFGTGYASLTHLQRFPVDVIKLDRSFIERIDDSDPKATAVIDAVLQMARLLGMMTVAEGIETADQARYLRARGCTSGQGYFFSHAIAAQQVARLMANLPQVHWQFAASNSPAPSNENFKSKLRSEFLK